MSKHPHTNFFILLQFLFLFFSCRNFKRTPDFQQGLQLETSKNEKMGIPKQPKNHPWRPQKKKTLIGCLKL
jgi:hypothetical protein